MKRLIAALLVLCLAGCSVPASVFGPAASAGEPAEEAMACRIADGAEDGRTAGAGKPLPHERYRCARHAGRQRGERH